MPLYVYHDESGPIEGEITDIFEFAGNALAKPGSISENVRKLFKGPKPWELSSKLRAVGNNWRFVNIAAVPLGSLDLVPAEFSAPGEDEIWLEFSDPAMVDALGFLGRSVKDVLSGMRDLMIEQAGAEAVNMAVPQFLLTDLDRVREIFGVSANDPDPAPEFSAQPTPGEAMPTEEEIIRREQAVAEQEERNRADAAAIAARHQEMELAEFSRYADDLLQDGRQFPLETARTIFQALPSDADTVEFSAPDGSTRTDSPREAFKAMLAGLPKVVPNGEQAASEDAEFATAEAADTATATRKAALNASRASYGAKPVK